MPTIDNYDVNVYYQYAARTQTLEAIQEEFGLGEADRVPYHTTVVDTLPKRSEMELLLGVVGRTYTPWALFVAPKKYRRQRRSPFTHARIAPSLGSEDAQEAALANLAGIQCSSEEEEEEKAAIIRCFTQLSKLNRMLDFVIGRIGQFLQG